MDIVEAIDIILGFQDDHTIAIDGRFALTDTDMAYQDGVGCGGVDLFEVVFVVAEDVDDFDAIVTGCPKIDLSHLGKAFQVCQDTNEQGNYRDSPLHPHLLTGFAAVESRGAFR
jgi:hypothetical protein